MGLIPNDQSRFVQAMKTIITKHKQLQTFKVRIQTYYLQSRNLHVKMKISVFTVVDGCEKKNKKQKKRYQQPYFCSNGIAALS